MVMRRYVLLVIFCWFILLTLPIAAQDAAPFATNTPQPPQSVIITPAAPLERYALRMWQEQDLLSVLLTSVKQLTPGAVLLPAMR